jgi:acyl-CoA dehydrogenase
MHSADLFPFSQRARDLASRLREFMTAQVLPAEPVYREEIRSAQTAWESPPVMARLKEEARRRGLWNLFLPDAELGAGLTNVEYARLAEQLGHSLIASEACNCSAPDTGNMEVLHHYGSEAQKAAWLVPLLAGEIRSCFAMTEPDVASSDATNIACRVTRSGDGYLIEGRKWWITNALDPRCKIAIVMGLTDPSASPHSRHSMVLVPMDSPGLTVRRFLKNFGYNDAPFGHGELEFDQVRVPAGNIILGEGRGFEIAQGRLGPGRVHHCMRLIGLAERALSMLCARATARTAFGSTLADKGALRERIARARIAIDQARLLTLHTAYLMDTVGNRAARKEIAAIKVVVPRMAQDVIDEAIQAYGAAGLTDDHLLAEFFAVARSLRIADGPDAVHIETVAKLELRGKQ